MGRPTSRGRVVSGLQSNPFEMRSRVLGATSNSNQQKSSSDGSRLSAGVTTPECRELSRRLEPRSAFQLCRLSMTSRDNKRKSRKPFPDPQATIQRIFQPIPNTCITCTMLALGHHNPADSGPSSGNFLSSDCWITEIILEWLRGGSRQ